MKTITTILLISLFCATHSQSVKFYVTRQWKYINFTWPDEDSLKTATAAGTYIPENNIIAGVKYYDDYYYITLPRMKTGVPATLGRIKAGITHNHSPDLEPYPSWEMNIPGDCNNLQNVQNVEIDTKGQIWIIDGGRVQTMMDPIVKCPPKLVVYDIREDRVNTVYQFTEDVAPKNGSFLYDIVVDETDGGYAYITDNSAHDPGIIVFSVKKHSAWKIRNPPSMSADPSSVQFSVNEITINAPINIAGIALGPKIHTSNDRVVVNEDREVYFSPLSSQNLYSINTSVLRNENMSRNGANYDSSIKDIGAKPSQTVGMIMDNQGILYYSLLGENAIGRWDSHTPFQSGQRLIARDNKYLEWPNSFAFDNSGNLTVLINSLNRFIYGKFDLNEYNFRLISSHVGGKSYLYDDNFNYDSNEAQNTPKDWPSPEPQPEPEPEPGPTQPNDHDMDDHTSDDDEVKITQSSGIRLMVTALPLVFSFIVMF